MFWSQLLSSFKSFFLGCEDSSVDKYEGQSLDLQNPCESWTGSCNPDADEAEMGNPWGKLASWVSRNQWALGSLCDSGSINKLENRRYPMSTSSLHTLTQHTGSILVVCQCSTHANRPFLDLWAAITKAKSTLLYGLSNAMCFLFPSLMSASCSSDSYHTKSELC